MMRFPGRGKSSYRQMKQKEKEGTNADGKKTSY